MHTLNDLYIIGAGGFGREVAWLVERINKIEPRWNLKGFIDDNASIWGKRENGIPVLGGCDYLKNQGEKFAVCAIGTSQIRKKIIDNFSGSRIKFATLIDPSVILSDKVNVGEGSIICAGTIITVNVNIGMHVIINLDCTVGHDAVISDYVTIYPGVHVSGNVEIGDCSELGTGMQIIQGKKIASNSVIGAGAVVVKDILESGTYVGVPVRNINE